MFNTLVVLASIAHDYILNALKIGQFIGIFSSENSFFSMTSNNDKGP